MAEIIRMPKMSDTMTEGVVVKWLVKEGDSIKSGDIIAEVETDKAEFDSYQAGTLLYIGVEEGKAAPVDGILAILGKPGEEYKSLLENEQAKPAAAAAPAAKPSTPPTTAPAVATAPVAAAQVAVPAASVVAPATVPAASGNGDVRLKASPLAKRLAAEKGIDLSMLKGSGEHGRIIKRDIDWFKPGSFVAAGSYASAAVTKESFEETTVSQMRKTIARRLSESKFSAPHFYLTMDIDMDEVVRARESVNQVTAIKISYNDFVVKAAATALRQHPAVNSSWLGDRIRTNHHIHIGVAVAVDEGLLGIEEFTAIVNPPDACILAVGAIREVPVVKNGAVVPGHTMKLTLSCDHRVVDGASGSAFLQTLKAMLEEPVLMFI